MERKEREAAAAVERAMVAIRRRQQRRTLARLARREQVAAAPDTAVHGVLDVVEEAESAGRAATVSSVAAALGVDQPRASRLVAAAVDAGLVRRLADQADGRRALLALTAPGRDQAERVHRFRRAVFAEAMANWSDAERAEFARLLTRFVAALDDQQGG